MASQAQGRGTESERTPTGDCVELNGGRFYRIRHYDRLPPFFMTLASGSDHWLFASTCGAVTSGRRDADSAVFPYFTEDKLIDAVRSTGSTCSLFVTRNGQRVRWEPFTPDGHEQFQLERSLYKSVQGSQLVFEETNVDLGLVYQYGWCFGDRYGLIRTASLTNRTSSPVSVAFLDGLLNLQPEGVDSGTYLQFSNLIDAYKQAELASDRGPAIFALTARLTDQPVPSEALLATTAWQVGLETPSILLSSRQQDPFRRGETVTPESCVQGGRGAFLLHTTLSLAAGETRRWSIAVNVRQDSSAVVALAGQLRDPEALSAELERDIAATDAVLRRQLAQADGLQACAEETVSAHHQANVLFNIMRGGIPARGYDVQSSDWRQFVRQSNASLDAGPADVLPMLPAAVNVEALRRAADATGSVDLARLARQYLPLTFSRRHGDPTRPWNRFAIQVRNPDGSPRLAYEGNWRDIFQNWEALGLSFPAYFENFITIFLCATTADGYNPYRLNQSGIGWDIPEPDAPWSAYGYWGDHQIIYLLRLLEAEAQFYPGTLEAWLDRPLFSHANVPYRLKPYAELLKDPRNSLAFDSREHAAVEARVQRLGSDGRLVLDADGRVRHVTLAEKLLVLLLAKLGNFVPDGGIWMNTQRPEWNDANNALAGYGLSVVTTGYLHRYLQFLQALLSGAGKALQLTASVADWLQSTLRVLAACGSPSASGTITDLERRRFMDAMGECASAYRARLYADGLSSATRAVDTASVQELVARASTWVQHCLRANRRMDGLYHAYNVLELTADGARVHPLQEMLEGQVAVLSSGLLAPSEALAVLQALRRSSMFREDQNSYMLYPRQMPKGFLERNCVSEPAAQDIPLLRQMIADGDVRLLVRDRRGTLHFNGAFARSTDVRRALEGLRKDPRYAAAAASDADGVVALFETTFDHRSYTGRSGSMFAYEGVGSIYWHMVAKLLLAAQECTREAEEQGAAETAALRACTHDIRTGLGFNKTPVEFGAFPTDPYSHTPWGRGAQQPGMTGQVKEELLTRLAELGLRVRAGQVTFDPEGVPSREFLAEPGTFACLAVDGRERSIPLPAQSLAFTFCQTPVVYRMGTEPKIVIFGRDGTHRTVAGYALDEATNRSLFARDGSVECLEVHRVATILSIR